MIHYWAFDLSHR